MDWSCYSISLYCKNKKNKELVQIILNMPRKLDYIGLACEAIFVVQYMTDIVLSGLKIAKTYIFKEKMNYY